MIFGQLVIGPPGSGKTTYCRAMKEFLQGLNRKVAVVNLDPGNDVLPYEADIDVMQLIRVEDIMEAKETRLGPNGSLVFCMEFLEANLDWLLDKLKQFSDRYILLDCPGQVELYTHHDSMQKIVARLQKSSFVLSALHLVDSHYCCDPAKFMSVLITSLTTMLKMEMPLVNVLSKADLIEKQGPLHFNLDFYTEVLDLNELVALIDDDPFLSRFKKLNKAIAELVNNYSLVSFCLLSVNSKNSMSRVLQAADKANGYVFGINEENRDIQNLLSTAMSTDFEDAKIAEVREKFMSQDQESSGSYVGFGR